MVCVRSLVISLVDREEIGKILSVMTSIFSVTPLLGNVIFSSIYRATLSSWPGLCFVLGGVCMVPVFCAFLYIFVVHRRALQEGAKRLHQPETKTEWFSRWKRSVSHFIYFQQICRSAEIFFVSWLSMFEMNSHKNVSVNVFAALQCKISIEWSTIKRFPPVCTAPVPAGHTSRLREWIKPNRKQPERIERANGSLCYSVWKAPQKRFNSFTHNKNNHITLDPQTRRIRWVQYQNTDSISRWIPTLILCFQRLRASMVGGEV